MRARPHEQRLGLDRAQEAQQGVARLRAAPTSGEIGQDEGGSFDREDKGFREAGLGDLGAQLLGPVEEGGGEVVGTPGLVEVAAVAEIRWRRISSCVRARSRGKYWASRRPASSYPS